MATMTIATGQRSRPIAISPGMIVTVTPATGASAVVEYTTNAIQDINNNVATWKVWPNGTVTAVSAAMFNKRGYIRVSAVSGAVVLDTNHTPTNDQLAVYSTDWGGTLGLSGAGLGLKSPGILAQSTTLVPVTGTTAETTLASIVIPANTIQPNGMLRTVVRYRKNASNSAGMTFGIRLAGVQLTTQSMGTNGSGHYEQCLWAVAPGSQLSDGGPITGNWGPQPTALSLDMTQPQTLTLTATMANAADTGYLWAYSVQLFTP